MSVIRVCPDCGRRSEDEVCPRCRTRTFQERAPRAREDPLVGQILDRRYSIDEVIGHGGMGAVYRGTQLATKQGVAIKVIRAEFAEDEEATRRFHREARAASLLTHPHTIRVIDFGQSESGDLYQVLEFLDGVTLRGLLKRDGRLPEARLARIAGEIAQSLAEAHRIGLAHRDLKPENVMILDAIGHPDFVKVLDFGIAKFLTGSSGESSVTRSGAVVGTPAYMTPEQARGVRDLTPAVDVYALGVILHEALSGAKPFEGDTPLSTLLQHDRAPIPDLPPQVASRPMAALVRQVLSKNPADRPDAADLAGILASMSATPRLLDLPPVAAAEAKAVPHDSGKGSEPRRPPAPSATPVRPAEDWERPQPAKSRAASVVVAGIGTGILAIAIGTWLAWSALSPVREAEHQIEPSVEAPSKAPEPAPVPEPTILPPARVPAEPEKRPEPAVPKLGTPPEPVHPPVSGSPPSKDAAAPLKRDDKTLRIREKAREPDQGNQAATESPAKWGSPIPAAGGPVAVPGLDKSTLQRVIASRVGQVRACYEAELQRNANLAGAVTVSLVIGPTGKVVSASIAKSSIGNAAVETCILARVRSWSFPPPADGGTVNVTYPFVFRTSR
jgi:serine/threonine-protein kinase